MSDCGYTICYDTERIWGNKMKMILEIRIVWACHSCEKIQEQIENEEWHDCCGHSMDLVFAREFKLVDENGD